MSTDKIENHITNYLTGYAQKNALDFISYLTKHEMQFERGGGYWEKKLYWCVNYKGQSVCYILIYSPASTIDSTEPWVVWSDDSYTNPFEDHQLDECIKEIAWKNVDICGNVNGDCGGCKGKISKIIFGKKFDNVCGTIFRFNNPDADAVECAKKIVAIRKHVIDSKVG